jgi:UDP-N-acetylglucosamine 4,6-dehydratase
MRKFFTHLPRYQKQIIAMGFDSLCICLSLWASMFLRYGHWQWKGPENSWLVLAILALFSTLPFFVGMGLYRAVLRYINSVTIITMIKATCLASVVLLAADALLLPGYVLPRSVPFIYFLFLTICVVGSRYFIQHWLNGVSLSLALNNLFKGHPKHLSGHGKPALIYGEGKMLAELISVLDSTRDYHPVVIIDNTSASAGGEINGRPIYPVNNMASAIEQFGVEEILLALPNATRLERKKIIADLEQYGLPIRTMPSFEDLSSGRMTLQDVQDIDIADVLGRQEVKPIEHLMSACIAGKVVMVTGAGGSIGSEIVRQVIKLKPLRLVLLDHSEFNLYAIDRELEIAKESLHIDVELVSVLANVTDQDHLYAIMSELGVNTVYHAAAYKHVPLVEKNIAQGLINNVWGTLACAQAAIAANVERFVLISTDKAVRPTNVMGASKRLAEMALQALNAESQVNVNSAREVTPGFSAVVDNKTRFTMVRFGNVLGSSGSVIPVFKEQIRMGGPITVTHPDINRYFMSIPEAAQLVIQAGAMGSGGDVFLLDMGEPIKIVDLARRMVSLSGLTLKNPENPEGDIDIVFTGLRPGEKLYEELLIGDNPEKTEHERIFKAHEAMLSWAQYTGLLKKLDLAIKAGDEAGILACLAESVNGFHTAKPA